MTDLDRYYQVLQVSPGASRSAIRASYRRLAKKHHPDRGGHPEQMVLLNEAYSVLINSEAHPLRDLDGEDSTIMTQPAEESSGVPDLSESRRIQSWVRLVSRLIDTLFEVLVGMFLLHLVSSLLLPSGINLFKVGYLLTYAPVHLVALYLLLWVYLVSFALLFESLQLAVWASTPGRWLLNTTIYDLNQGKTTFSHALRRSLSVWTYGLGLGVPVFTLFTLLASYQRLILRGTTIWDETGGYFVAHLGLGPYRILAALLFLLLLFSAFHLLLGYLQGFWW